jgi:hypothetical protein
LEGGLPTSYNPASGATGPDQFTAKTWLGTVQQEKPAWAKGMSVEQVLNARRDPQKSAEMEQALRRNNAAVLGKQGIPVNNASLYSLHHFGPDTGVKFLKASGDTKSESIFPPVVLDSNPYLRGQTKDQVLQIWAKRSGDPSMAGVGAGLPTGAQAATTPGTGMPSLTTPKLPIYAGGGQFDTPKKLDQEVIAARTQAQQTADATVAATERAMAAQGQQLSEDDAGALYRRAFNHAVTDRIGSYETRDQARLVDKLLPGVRVDLQGKKGVKGAYGGPNEAVRRAGNPFATGDLTKDKAFYQQIRQASGQRNVSPFIRQAIGQFANLKKMDPAYARRIAQPLGNDTVSMPPVSISGQ